MEDGSIPVEQVEAMKTELEKARTPHRIFRYDGAEHGFFCDARASYNELAASDAWQQVKELFQQHLPN
jgi:carboxymethylenebutenolidase